MGLHVCLSCVYCAYVRHVLQDLELVGPLTGVVLYRHHTKGTLPADTMVKHGPSGLWLPLKLMASFAEGASKQAIELLPGWCWCVLSRTPRQDARCATTARSTRSIANADGTARLHALKPP